MMAKRNVRLDLRRGSAAMAAALLFALPALAADSVVRELDAAQAVVLANANMPESVELARHYMQLRGIPTNHLCLLDLPVGETISRRLYERRLRDPLLAFLRDQGVIEQVRRDEDSLNPHDSSWRTVRHRLRYLVSIYGVPLRIAETRPYFIAKISRLLEEPFQRDEASVDSELACLLWDAYEIKGFQSNPHYNQVAWSRSDRLPRPVVIAARLDGPDPAIVRRMIDDTVVAERTGLHGRAYLDLRSIRDPDYILGDFWMHEAGERLRRLGLEIIADRNDALFPDHFPMEDAALYLGWYSEHVAGPFLQPGFRFRTGAVAYHLHSTSAKTLRSTTRQWAGPLLAAGAAAVMGSVNEPYLNYTPDVQIFVDRLASGYTFGESAYLSQRALSWQITVIGDPLYRPFAYNQDERIRALADAANPDVAWEHLRRINALADQQQLNLALAYAREAIGKKDSPILREKVADLFAKNELWPEALAEYRRIVEEAGEAITAVRVGYRLLLILRILNRTADAQPIEDAIRAAWPDSPYLRHLDGAIP